MGLFKSFLRCHIIVGGCPSSLDLCVCVRVFECISVEVHPNVYMYICTCVCVCLGVVYVRERESVCVCVSVRRQCGSVFLGVVFVGYVCAVRSNWCVCVYMCAVS